MYVVSSDLECFFLVIIMHHVKIWLQIQWLHNFKYSFLFDAAGFKALVSNNNTWAPAMVFIGFANALRNTGDQVIQR